MRFQNPLYKCVALGLSTGTSVIIYKASWKLISSDIIILVYFENGYVLQYRNKFCAPLIPF